MAAASAAVVADLAASAAAALAAVVPVAVGSVKILEDRFMAPETAVPENKITEFVTRLQKAAGENLESVILYGSAASGEYNADYSNVNLLAILKDTSLPKLLLLAPAVGAWTKQKHPAPLMITRDELERSADVFSIELLDMRRQHRVLYGPDLVANLQIPMHLHRAQLEYELREKLILLRQRLLMEAPDEKHIWNILLRSVPAFATLFRHALIAQGQPAPATKREAVKALASALGFDATAIERLLDIRDHRADRKQFRAEEIAAQYVAAVEQVTGAVDRMLDSPGR
jgi:predicted nucleotidyltransferase